MSAPATLPREVEGLVRFAKVLRANGFLVAPEQTTTFVAGVGMLGPRSLRDVRMAAAAAFAPPPDRRALFDALFDHFFLGVGGLAPPDTEETDEDLRVQDEGSGFDADMVDRVNETGQATTRAEALSRRDLLSGGDEDTLRLLRRRLKVLLPVRRGYRRVAAKRGPGIDLARSLKEIVRHDGETLELPRLRRRPRARALLLLIDVSGSMKQRSDANLRLAHAVVQAVPRVEVFTFGTRLTRLTRALRLKQRAQALGEAAALVADWDGGTRIGEALQAFLAVPRFAGYARGAIVLVLSDGLERGDPAPLTRAVEKLAARAWRLHWLTPLAADPAYKPETTAMKAIAPFLDRIADGASTQSLARHILQLGQERAA